MLDFADESSTTPALPDPAPLLTFLLTVAVHEFGIRCCCSIISCTTLRTNSTPVPSGWGDRNGARDGDFTAQHFTGLIGQTQIPVAAQVVTVNVQRHERALRRQLPGGRDTLIHSRAF